MSMGRTIEDSITVETRVYANLGKALKQGFDLLTGTVVGYAMHNSYLVLLDEPLIGAQFGGARCITVPESHLTVM